MLPQYAGKSTSFEGKHSELSKRIIKVFYDVHNELGYGFSEKVYQKSFAIALRQDGMKVDEQVLIKVYFRGQLVGEFYADMVVDELIILELKAADKIIDEFEAQLLNYLKSSEIEVGYVLNFGRSATFKRKIFDNERKGALRGMKK